MVWVDKKTENEEHYYFPSMLNNYIDNLFKFKSVKK